MGLVQGRISEKDRFPEKLSLKLDCVETLILSSHTVHNSVDATSNAFHSFKHVTPYLLTTFIPKTLFRGTSIKMFASELFNKSQTTLENTQKYLFRFNVSQPHHNNRRANGKNPRRQVRHEMFSFSSCLLSRMCFQCYAQVCLLRT